MKRALATALLAAIVLALSACGGGAKTDTPASSPPPDSGVRITIEPTSISIFAFRSVTFRATVTGTTNTAVTWENGPTFSARIPGSYTVTAISVADPTKRATAHVTVRPFIPPPGD